MGTLTQAQMKTELVSALGNRDDITDARQTVFLNLAQVRIARLYDWNELQTVKTGTIGDAGNPATDKYLDFPVSTIRKIYSFKIVNTTSIQDSRKLRYVHQKKWDESVPETQAWTTDIPVIYTIWRDKFEFWKIPDQQYNYELRTVDWPTDFVAATTTQTSELDRKDDCIIALAISWAFLTLRESEEANRWWTVYRDMINNAVGQDIEEYEIDIKPTLFGQGRHNLSREPWRDPFNMDGRI